MQTAILDAEGIVQILIDLQVEIPETLKNYRIPFDGNFIRVLLALNGTWTLEMLADSTIATILGWYETQIIIFSNKVGRLEERLNSMGIYPSWYDIINPAENLDQLLSLPNSLLKKKVEDIIERRYRN